MNRNRGRPKVTETITNPDGSTTERVVDPGEPETIYVDTTPKVERVETPPTVTYRINEDLPDGETNRIEGTPKIEEITTTYNVDPNTGTKTPNEPTTRVVQEGTPTIIEVGGAPDIKRTETPFKTTYVFDENKPYGERSEEPGKVGVITTTTTYMVDPKTGEKTPNEPTAHIIPAIDTVVTIGTKPTVETTEEDLGVVYEEDPAIEHGQTTEVPGEPKVTTTTTTYTGNPQTGEVTPNEPTSEVTNPGRPKVVKVGTKPKVERTEEPPSVVYVYDPSVPEGERVEVPGEPRVTETTTTYTVDPKTGEVTAGTPTSQVVNEGKATVVKVGSKPKVERNEEDLPPVYEIDEELPFGERIEIPGEPKVTETVTTYSVDPKTGDVTPNEPTSSVVNEGKPKVIKVGGKPKVEITEGDNSKVYEGDDGTPVGESSEVPGTPTTTRTTIVYTVDPKTGEVTPKETTEITDGTPTVVKVGTKPKVERSSEDLPPVYEFDENLPAGEVVKVPGRPKVVEITTRYTVDPKTGEVTPGESVVTVIDEGTPEIIRTGNKPNVKRVSEDLPPEHVDDPTLEFGKVVEIPGRPKIIEITTPYITDPNTGEVTEGTPITHVIDPGTPKVIKTGAKKVTRFVTPDGEPISEEIGVIPPKDIPGYTFVRTNPEKDGVITHVYVKNEVDKGTGTETEKPVLEITRHVTPDGMTVEEGTHPAKELPGYVHTGTNVVNGVTTHTYEKAPKVEVPKEEPLILTRFVSDNGDFDVTEEGTLGAREFEGYKYVRTTNENGVTTHHYEKVVEAPKVEDPKVEEPEVKPEEPKIEQPEPKTEVPKAADPKVEEPEVKPEVPKQETPKALPKVEAKSLPKTGDETSGLLAGLVGLLAGIGLLRRKKED